MHFQAAKDVRASQNTLVDIFERIESFFRRLEVYTVLERVDHADVTPLSLGRT